MLKNGTKLIAEKVKKINLRDIWESGPKKDLDNLERRPKYNKKLDEMSESTNKRI